METVKTGFTVADYCDAMRRGEIVVNRDYQRSDKVWPHAARSYLIETILLNLPVPKFSLRQLTDLKSKKTFKEIVDGQQRSSAILDFFEDRLRLSRTLETEELKGRTYSTLEDEHKQRFLTYPLTIDLFVAGTAQEIRDVFRRINSYTVPLNPEEQRHAMYQGHFKWFIHRLARRFDESFLGMGLFSEKQLVRMADTKLLTEISHAMLNGIVTTKRKELRELYEAKDEEFPEEGDLEKRLGESFDQLITWEPLHGGPLMRPHIVYALVLAIAHVKRRVASLESLFPSPRLREFDDAEVLTRLGGLGEALTRPDRAGRYKAFVMASAEKTNVREQREQRLVSMCRALVGRSA